MNRLLVIRGGAIGDFVLTLPALKLLRDRFPKAQLEIVGYKHIAALAEKRFYADAIRSIEAGQLARFFAKDSVLPAELVDYFASFDLIASYLFDPDGIFEANLKRCRIRSFIAAPSKPDNREHAALQLARPLEALGLHLKDPAARIYPSEADRTFAAKFLGSHSGRPIALHPGSGSETKNWPIENWQKLGDDLLAHDHELIVVSGEADEERVGLLESAWKRKAVTFARTLPLPHLAALLEDTIFLGHDSGISHIAAAVGARCVVLFGSTDPAIWAPANKNVTVLRAPEGQIRLLEVEAVFAAIPTS
ncbi:MAG: glycosyltransferase family 9 protein [Verrucomicrobiaceae bacterium]|nr:glycosyltransferase family 9 protein [Verrucomicrobiaceae bacterium]